MGAVQAGLCCLRYFTDDHGRTVVERGLDHLRISTAASAVTARTYRAPTPRYPYRRSDRDTSTPTET
ncbi:spirocyclase AveC family protein [Nocardia transvalensis]|uniref:spirocyclase AveC family protein n=1 Tax=Nocardia transvalensis TaxID=37333 RepID=UPI003B82FDC9